MPVVSDGKKQYVTNGAADGVVRATNDPDGSNLNGLAGNDNMKGGRYDDLITGGAGDDTAYGGDGADQFRFYGDEIEGASDLDKVFDLDFSEGDKLVFGDYGISFSDADGANAANGGASVAISSFAGLAAVIDQAGGAITFSEKGSTNVLILDIYNAGTDQTQTIHITGGYDALVAELVAA